MKGAKTTKPRRAQRKKAKARKTQVPRAPSSTGGFTIIRKVPTIWLSNSATAGVPLVRGGGGTINPLTLGTPEANPIFSDIYSVPFTLQFALDNLSQYTDITNICDKYKISNVRVKCMYNCTAVQGSQSQQPYPSFMPFVKFISDEDDATPQNTDQLDAKMGLKAKTLSEGRLVKMSCRPKVAGLVYDNTLPSAYSVPNKSVWLNSGYVNVPHYAIKGYFENLSLQNNQNSTSCVTFELEYTIKCKDLQ